MVRLNALARYGGFWADASIFMTQSLKWIIQKECDFFGYYLDEFTTDVRYPVVENWFFACIPRCPFVSMWRDALMHIFNFSDEEEYVQYYKQFANIQNIPYPEYLTSHVAAQYVMQKRMTSNEIKRSMCLLKAEDGPYKYLADNDWDSHKAIVQFHQGQYKLQPIIKMRGEEREVLDSIMCGTFHN